MKEAARRLNGTGLKEVLHSTIGERTNTGFGKILHLEKVITEGSEDINQFILDLSESVVKKVDASLSPQEISDIAVSYAVSTTILLRNSLLSRVDYFRSWEINNAIENAMVNFAVYVATRATASDGSIHARRFEVEQVRRQYYQKLEEEERKMTADK